MKKILLSVILFFAFCVTVNAACTGSSPNLTAASANETDVAACVSVATNGDTINIPACAAGSCSWTSQLDITIDVKIVGAGIDVTYITNGMSGSSDEALIKFTPDAPSRTRLNTLSGTGTIEVTGITFTSSTVQPYTYATWISNTSTPVIDRVKIHGNKYVKMVKAVYPMGYVHGVFYSNTLVSSSASMHQGNAANSFYNDRMSLGGQKGWFTEDNTFSFSGDDVVAMQSEINEGGGGISRYNIMTGTMTGGSNFAETHGKQPTGIYGPQITEIYGNNITISSAGYPFVLRGGKGIFLYNVIAVNANINIYNEFDDTVAGVTLSGGGSLNSCTDHVQGSSRQTCTDSCICQKVHDTYILNNRASVTGSLRTAIVSMDDYNENTSTTNNPLEVVENTEFFQDAGSFNGSAGVGCGTLASMPATCTTGVGYWATNQSCTDMTGMVGANPSTPISGTLYKCTATNTWTSYYTPYTYPHPLRGTGTYYNVTPSASAGGSINPATVQSVLSGNTTQFTYSANSGYTFSSWTGTCGGSGTTTYTTNAIIAACTVIANFSATSSGGNVLRWTH